jgi:aminodeoxyfutalosine deaminase
MAFSLRARVVFPVDQPAIEHGVVTIVESPAPGMPISTVMSIARGRRISAVGSKSNGDEVIDLGSVALLPGLVNAHTHLEFSYLLQPLGQPGMSLVDWIRLVIAERSRGDLQSNLGLLNGLSESNLSGVTTLGNISTGTDLPFDDVTHFQEVIGFSRARSESSMKALMERLGPSMRMRLPPRQGISPHAPYTVSLTLVKELVSLARDRSLPIAMHVAESTDELELLRDGTGAFKALLEERSMWDAKAIRWGSRPLDYLQILAEAPRTLVIHGNYLDNEELAYLADKRERMSLVYCPRTHDYFAHAPYPLEHALARGVRVALGTDSRASNPDLSLLAEMRYVAQAYPSIDPHDILRMGTLAAAEALGRDADVGSITPGKIANLVAVPLSDEDGTPDKLLSAVFADSRAVCGVWIGGRRVRDAES